MSEDHGLVRVGTPSRFKTDYEKKSVHALQEFGISLREELTDQEVRLMNLYHKWATMKKLMTFAKRMVKAR